MHYLVVYKSGLNWVAGRERREQSGWDEHAAFMNVLENQGVAVLGGPLEDGETVPVIMRSDDEASLRGQLITDPWITEGVLRLWKIYPWVILLGGSKGRKQISRETQYFMVVRQRGPSWVLGPVSTGDAIAQNPLASTMRSQIGWGEHADFMDELVNEGFVLLGGPVDYTDKAVFVIQSDSEAAADARFGNDPWTSAGLLQTTTYRWDILLGGE